jgi:hypothetical protein
MSSWFTSSKCYQQLREFLSVILVVNCLFVCLLFWRVFMLLRLVSSVVLALSCVVSYAQTAFPVRTVLAGEVISVPKGDYLITRQVVVRVGGKLILESGVNAKVSIPLPIQVYGDLEIRGTSSEPVVIGPDASGVCGTIAVYPTAGAPRPKLNATNLDLIHTRDSNSLYCSGGDVTLTSSRILNKSTSLNRACIASASNAVVTLTDCYLEASSNLNMTGITVDNSPSSSVNYLNLFFYNIQVPVKSSKLLTSASGSVE